MQTTSLAISRCRSPLTAGSGTCLRHPFGRAFARPVCSTPSHRFPSRSSPSGKSFRVIRSCVKTLRKKYCSSVFQKYMVLSARPASLRGVRVVTNVDAGYDGRFGFARRARTKRTAKSRGPDPPTLGSSSPGRLQGRSSRATVAIKPGTPGRARISRNPSCRECRRFRRTCGD